MAGSYDPSLLTAKDRIRRMIGDRRAPWRFDDAEIVATLSGDGEAAEIRAAISLLEEETEGTTVSSSIRQGSYARSKTVSGGNAGRIEALRERLASLVAGPGATGMAVAEAEFPRPEGFPPPWCPYERD